MANWYCGSVNYTAVPVWQDSTIYSVGNFVRQLINVTTNEERIFRCTTGGTSDIGEPFWNTSKGGTTNDNTVVWTEVTGNSTYGWSASHFSLFNALSYCAAGDTIYVADDHSESLGSQMILTSPGTVSNPVNIICCDNSAAPPTNVATTASVAVTGGASMDFKGYAYVYGISFASGNSTNVGYLNFNYSDPWHWKFQNCSLKLNGTNSSSRITLGNAEEFMSAIASQYLELISSDISFGATGQGIVRKSKMTWLGGSITGTAPTTLFIAPSSTSFIHGGDCVISGVDLSLLGSGKNIVDMDVPTQSHYFIENCKLGSSVNVTTNTPVSRGAYTLRLVNCDSGATNYRYYKQVYEGTIFHETTIVRSGGASDGTTPISRKMVTTANSKFSMPLASDPMIVWNENTGLLVTVTVEIITDGVTLKDDEVWLEVYYAGSSSDPKYSIITDAKENFLTTAANQATSTVTWTTTGLSSPTKQKLSVTFTPQAKGIIKGVVMLAKASTTMYLDPLMTLS